MKIYYPATALVLNYVAISVTDAEDVTNSTLNDVQEFVEALYDDDEVLDCITDDVAFKKSHPDLFAAELDFAAVDASTMDMQVKGDEVFLGISYDESKKEILRNECANIGLFEEVPAFDISCTFQGSSITIEIDNLAGCYRETGACASVSSEDFFSYTLEEGFKPIGIECEVPSFDNASTGVAFGASATFRGAVASAIFVGIVFAA